MRVLCLCNARSGGRSDRVAALRGMLAHDRDVQFAVTESAAQMAQRLNAFAPAAGDLLVVSGGDGTLQSLLTALLSREETGTDLPMLAILPGGSTNMSASDINRHRRWDGAARVLSRAVYTGDMPPVVPRPVLRVHDPAGLRAGFFLGAGAVVEGIRYCNDQLWGRRGAARQERTAGLAMARTILGVLRAEPPFDQPLSVSLLACGDRGDPLRLHPSSGALALLTSTLGRLLIGTRPHWGEEAGDVQFTLITRSARLTPHMLGVMGVPLMSRPSGVSGFHSHNCRRLELHLRQSRKGAAASYAIDGELFPAPSGALTIDADCAPRFLVL